MLYRQSYKEHKAFTLIELSIVLVIISLVVGGIVGGKSLIKSAEVTSITSDLDKYTAYIYLFQDQYDYLPGDIPNAKDYWPDNSRGTGFIARNGNGDRSIDDGDEGGSVFQHLSLAEIINVTYDFFVFPDTKRSHGGYLFHYSHHFIGGNQINVSIFGALEAFGILTPSEMKKIDKKMDDGKAQDLGGRMFGRSDNHGICNSGTEFNLTNKEQNCRIYYYPKL